MLLLDPTKFPDTQAGKVTNALQNILAQMVNERGKPPSSRRSISTEPMQAALNSIFSRGTLQQDVEEFVTYILNEVSDVGNFNGTRKNPAEYMRGNTLQNSECTDPGCNRVSSQTNMFFLLQLPLQCQQLDTVADVNDIVLEVLTREDVRTYKCDHSDCTSVTARVNFSLQTPPEILGLHLKRFLFDSGSTKKVMDKVEIPNIITLYCSDKSTVSYILYSIVKHVGPGPKSGHYYAICRCSGCAAREGVSDGLSPGVDRADWQILDDSSFSEKMSLSACIAKDLSEYGDEATPYLVFYARACNSSELEPCPVCGDNGHRLKKLAEAVLLQSLPELQGSAEANQNDAAEASGPSCMELIQQFLQGRSFVRLTQVGDH